MAAIFSQQAICVITYPLCHDLCQFMLVTWVRVTAIGKAIAHGLLGAVSIRKTVLPGMAIPMLKIRRPNGRLIFNMEITILR